MTITPWITKAGKYPVAHTPCPYFKGEAVRLDVPRAGILHTTEGGWDGSMGVFRRHFAPHFVVGLDSHKKPAIAQLVPVGTIGAAIVTHNNLAVVQIEMVGYAQDKPWLPDAETLDALASLMLTCRDVWGIALAHPWKDGDFGRASDNPHRHSGKLGTFCGWLGHGDCPLPDSHWDPGALKYSMVFARALEIEKELKANEHGPEAGV